jgi:hypothetical protein
MSDYYIVTTALPEGKVGRDARVLWQTLLSRKSFCQRSFIAALEAVARDFLTKRDGQ